jgi:molybdate transport system substrate-binding protein
MMNKAMVKSVAPHLRVCLRVRMVAAVAATLLASAFAATASAAELRVLSAGAVKAPVSELLVQYTRASGNTVRVDYMPVGSLQQLLTSGSERPDVVIATTEGLDDFQKQGHIAAQGRIALGSTGVGVAVKSDAPSPDISTVDAFRKALLDAKSLVYVDPTKGTSGKHFAQVLQQLGIADAVKAKSTLLDGGYVVEPVGKGQIEMGVHQITEILPVPGVKLVGPLPAALQKNSVYVGAIGARAQSPAEAAQLLQFLSANDARGVFAAKGFTAPTAP